MEKEYEEFDENDRIITLEFDDGSEEDYEVVMTFDLEFDEISRDYIALLDLNKETGEPDENSELVFYRYSEGEDGEELLDEIGSDAEFDAVCEEFDRLLAEVEG